MLCPLSCCSVSNPRQRARASCFCCSIPAACPATLLASRCSSQSAHRITAISTHSLKGKVTILASGLVVTPGFIDLHSHGQTPENYRYKAMDGVTTALELEVGVSPVSEWYAKRTGKAQVNYGASAGHIPVRMAVMKDQGDFLPRDAAMNRPATADEQKLIVAGIVQGLREGALGIGLGLAYTPTATHEEILGFFYLAADWKRTIFVHVRYAGTKVPGIFESLQEVIGNAAASGASLHIVHINSQALQKTPEALRMIAGARARGLDVTTEAYPYVAGQTRIESALFEPGWQQRTGMTYSDLMWPTTGERLTELSFARYRKQGGIVIEHMNTEEMVRKALTNSLVMISSDGLIANGIGHPRGAGTYARVLGQYVREQKALSLMEALRKCTLMPAQRLELTTPQMQNKGRLRVGADADISIFDPLRVIDKATYEEPAQYSEGFRYVMVGGKLVVREGKLVEGAFPGEPIRAVLSERVAP